jgi:hypothetical protein
LKPPSRLSSIGEHDKSKGKVGHYGGAAGCGSRQVVAAGKGGHFWRDREGLGQQRWSVLKRIGSIY